MAAKTGKKRRRNKGSAKATADSLAVAPGQALGYFLQETLLTHRLLSAPVGAFLSLEVLEDVAIHQAGSPQELIQTVSTSGSNPVADRHPKLWKTLSNWLTAVEQLKLDPSHVQFVLYVSDSVGGPLVDAMNAASTPAAAQIAVAAARDELWGPAPEFPKRADLPLPLAKFVNAVLSTPDDMLVPFVMSFELQCGSGSPHGDFLSKLAQQIILEETDIEIVAPQMLGWVKQRLELSLENQQPAMISRDEFFLAMRAFIRATAVRQILRSFASTPSGEEKEKERLKTYVRQLELIQLNDTWILGAITDFLMSASERVAWAERGLVHPASFDELDTNLRQVWGNHGLVAQAAFASDKPVAHGQSLYGNCMNHQTPVQGMAAPSYFVRGCFHRLADSKEVGWHPDFAALLAETETE